MDNNTTPEIKKFEQIEDEIEDEIEETIEKLRGIIDKLEHIDFDKLQEEYEEEQDITIAKDSIEQYILDIGSAIEALEERGLCL